MHLLRYDPNTKTLAEVMPGEFAAMASATLRDDPTCRYFYVEGKRAAVPILTRDGIGEIVWEHPSYQPPSPANQHRATDEQWAQTNKYGNRGDYPLSSCILELRDRIQQLEAAQQVPVTSSAADQMLALQDQIRDGALSLADALKEIGAPEPASCPQPSTLVDRVANALYNVPLYSAAAAPAAIREVAKWLRSEYRHGTAWANLLDDHAGQ